MRRFCYAAFGLLLFCGVPGRSAEISQEGSTPAETVQYARPALLVEPAALAKPDVASRFVILDTRRQAEYEQEHIPGARWVNHEEWSKAFGDGRDADGWSQRIGALGIGPDSRVVVYDNQGLRDAARIWWILRYWGVQDAHLLNGTWKQWQAEGRPTSHETPAVAPVAFAAQPHAERLATKAQVLDSLAGRTLQIVDSRSENEFCGLEKLKNSRGGAIPGAKHLEWSDLIDQSTHRFKRPDELQAIFRKAGIDLQRPTASHCQSGGRASVMVFGLELMGAGDVSNYYHGWSEWGNSADTPIVVPERSGPR
jgi:thiosulfate/3-mercaptopyruvate sulfurtransferase